MSYYKGPKLDINNFQRESDGTITVKVCDSITRQNINSWSNVYLINYVLPDYFLTTHSGFL